MTVTLSKYDEINYMVTSHNRIPAVTTSLEKAREFASRISGEEDYVDTTGEETKKPSKKKEKKKEVNK